jgi:hypothetical protein
MEWRLTVRVITALTCAAATAYGIWRVEWFDVFRWGAPSAQLFAVYAAYISIAGVIGWFVAVLVTPRSFRGPGA